ncbi:MAG: hypothetical protein AAF211_11565 [Myxococcota bacterium]
MEADRERLLDIALASGGSASVAIAANLIQAQGGTLRVAKSERWPGDAFSIALPLVASGQADLVEIA